MTSSEGCTTHRYTLRFKADALAEWNALDVSVRAPLKKLLAKRLDNPPFLAVYCMARSPVATSPTC